MTVIDRRKGSDRRRDPRHAVSVNVDWEDPSGRRSAKVGDLSVSGCFLLTGGEVDEGQLVKVYFPLSNGKTEMFWGRVVDQTFDVGFSIKFVSLTDGQLSLLERLIGNLAKKA